MEKNIESLVQIFLSNKTTKNQNDLYGELYNYINKYSINLFRKFSSVDFRHLEPEDVTICSIEIILKNLHTYNRQMKFLPWVKTIVYHEFLRHLRQCVDKPVISLEKFTNNTNSEEIIDIVLYNNSEEKYIEEREKFNDNLKQKIKHVFSLVHKKYAEILYYFYIKNIPINMLQNYFNVPRGTILSRLFTARNKFLIQFRKLNYRYV